MAALKLDMTIPLGNDAGHVQLIIDIKDIGALSADNRAFIADTCAEFCAFAGRVFAPFGLAATAAGVPDELPPAEVHDPNLDVLRGVLGSR